MLDTWWFSLTLCNVFCSLLVTYFVLQGLYYGIVCPSLHKLIISPSILLEVANDSDTETLSSVPRVMNEIVVELYHFMNRNSECTYYTLWRWLSRLLGDEWPTNNFPIYRQICTEINYGNSHVLPKNLDYSEWGVSYTESRGKIVTPVCSSLLVLMMMMKKYVVFPY